MVLTKNFTLEEMTHTSYNVKNIPNQKSINSLKLLCEKVLQPLRDMYGKPININSGYRCLTLNNLVGSKSTSQHLKGEAVDIDQDSKSENKILFDLIKNNFVFDQLINESDYSWIHVSYKAVGNRKQILKL